MPESTDRLQRLDQERQAPGQVGRLPPVGEALQALRGGPCTVAVTMVAAIGALPRCEHPRERMPCWGLMPSEYSPGAHRRQGALPQAGNTQARRARGAGTWAYRSPATVRRHLPLRLDNQPKVLQDSRGKAQGRRCRRYRHRGARGTHTHVVTGAMARALAGCLWAMAKPVPLPPSGHRSHRSGTPHAAGFRRASAKTPPRGWGPYKGRLLENQEDVCRTD